MRLDKLGHSGSPTGRILNYLQQFGTSSMKDMVATLGVSWTAGRQPLAILLAQGLVTAGQPRDGLGRPPWVYQLSDKARKVASPWLESLALVVLEEVLVNREAWESTPSERLSAHLG